MHRVPVGKLGVLTIAGPDGAQVLLDRPAVVARPELVADAVIELVENGIVDDEAGRFQQPLAQEEPAAGMALVVVEIVQAFLIEEPRRPAWTGRVKQGGLTAEDRLAQRRLGSRPADHLPAVNALHAGLESASLILIDERAGHRGDTIVRLKLGREIHGRDKRCEPPGDGGLPAVVVGAGVKQGVIGIDLDLRRLAGGVHGDHPAIALSIYLGAGHFIASLFGPDWHANLALGAAAEHDRRLRHLPLLIELDGDLAQPRRRPSRADQPELA